MTQIGLGGYDAPTTMDGVPYETWEGIQARAGTWRHREPYRPDFGLGLDDGLRNPAPTAAQWRGRIRSSFASMSGVDLERTTVVIAADTVRLRVELSED